MFSLTSVMIKVLLRPSTSIEPLRESRRIMEVNLIALPPVASPPAPPKAEIGCATGECASRACGLGQGTRRAGVIKTNEFSYQWRSI